jgi:type VI secretion system protein ImpM
MSEQSSGYFGKIPGRGDFVGAGLPLPVVRAWDKAVSAALAGAKEMLADRWSELWLEAPVWRFALPDSQCGPASLLGLWMPSVDRAGRHFPLLIATSCPGASPELMARHGTAWLDSAEDAGRGAIADDLTPDELMARIPLPPDLSDTADTGLPCHLPPTAKGGIWWTDGGPFVPARGMVLDAMPEAEIFVTMLVTPSPAQYE